jgi:hypothetical protein
MTIRITTCVSVASFQSRPARKRKRPAERRPHRARQVATNRGASFANMAREVKTQENLIEKSRALNGGGGVVFTFGGG